MSATAKPLPGANMDETAVYQANDVSDSGPHQPTGKLDMLNSNPVSPGTGSLHVRIGKPAARWLYHQAGHRPRRIWRGVLRHVRRGQGSGSQARSCATLMSSAVG